MSEKRLSQLQKYIQKGYEMEKESKKQSECNDPEWCTLKGIMHQMRDHRMYFYQSCFSRSIRNLLKKEIIEVRYYIDSLKVKISEIKILDDNYVITNKKKSIPELAGILVKAVNTHDYEKCMVVIDRIVKISIIQRDREIMHIKKKIIRKQMLQLRDRINARHERHEE
ncbi:unnamed protein product, partial [marine sediment metagenome]